MALQWIPLDSLEPHPENSNRMPPRLLEKLKRHIQRTGLYEPLVVRPLTPQGHYQILNGHHRAQVLRELGHTHARCDVWEVDDGEARLLLATLNRLEGRDDPTARASLVARLAAGRSAEDLARLLPEPADAVERLVRLASPPPEPAAPGVRLPQPMTFFLTEEQHEVVREALEEAGHGGLRTADRELDGEHRGAASPCANPKSEIPIPKCLPRAEALERLALWDLEARNLR